MLFGAVKQVFLGSVLVQNILEVGGMRVWMAERCQIQVVHGRLENFFHFFCQIRPVRRQCLRKERTCACALPSLFGSRGLTAKGFRGWYNLYIIR